MIVRTPVRARLRSPLVLIDEGWRQDFEEWQKGGSDLSFHGLGSVKT